MGVTLRQIIYDIGGGIQRPQEIQAVQTGGTVRDVSESMLDLPIDYERLASAGSIMGSGGNDCDGRRHLHGGSVAKYFLNFTRRKSAAKCGCRARVGTMPDGRTTHPQLRQVKREGDLENWKPGSYH